MQCPNCGAQMGLEDAACPYCSTPNAMAAQHQSDMAHFRREYQRTQSEVMQKTSLLQRHGSWLVILAVLLVALVVGVILNVFAWDIGYSMRTHEMERTIDEDMQAMDAFLEQGDYGQFLGYYIANDMSLDYENPYQGVRTVAGAYVDLVHYVSALNDDSEYSFRPERISDTCGYLAEDLNKIFAIEEYYSYDVDRYLPADKRVYVEDMQDRAAAIAKTYFGLTDQDIQEIPNMSTHKLATVIEEGISS